MTKATDGRRNILIITEEFPPDPGGIAVSAQRIAQGFSNRGARVEVIALDSSRPLPSTAYAHSEEYSNYMVTRVGPHYARQIGIHPENISEPARATYRQRMFEIALPHAKKVNPDVVLSLNLSTSGLIGCYISRKINRPHIASARGIDISRGIFSFRELALLENIIRGSVFVTCVNEHLLRSAEMAFPWCTPRLRLVKNSTVIPPGIVTGRRNYIRTISQWRDSDFVVAFLGVAREKKGIQPLLSALTEHNREDIRLLAVGTDLTKVTASFGEKARALSDRGVLHCTGHLPREKALAIVAEADVITLPSIDDGLANALLEGMALGLAPIVSSIFSDVVDQSCGLVVPVGDVDALREAFCALADDRSRCRRLGHEAQKRIAHEFNIHREIDQYSDLIERAIRRYAGAEVTDESVIK